jgi:SsrA-binding protein
MPKAQESGRKVVARNRKAHHEYHLEEFFEAGVVLMGSEIKSIRANRVSLQEGYVQARVGELWLMNVHVAAYEQAGVFGHDDPLRPRKLLLNKREIARIITRVQERGYTIIPTQIYLERGLAKIQIALARGKRLHDKRETIAKRDAEREIRRMLKDG